MAHRNSWFTHEGNFLDLGFMWPTVVFIPGERRWTFVWCIRIRPTIFFGCMMGIQPLTIFLLFCFPTEHGDDVDIWWYMLIMIWCFWWWWYDGDDDVDEGQWFLQSTSSSTMVDCDINDVRTPGSVRRSQATAGIYFTDWMVKHGETKQFEWISWWFVSMQLMVRNASTQLID